MDEADALLLVLCLLYLSECVAWAHRHSLAFRTLNGRRWRIALPSGIGGNADGGLILLDPLPPLGPVFLAHLLPLSLSPGSALAFISQTVGAAGRPAQRGTSIPYEHIRSVAVTGKDVRINSEQFVRCGGARQAALVAEVLKRLADMPEGERAGEIARTLESAFDVEAIRARIAQYAGRARTLRVLCNVHFLYLFVAAPAVVWHFGVTRFLIPLAAGMWILALASAGFFWRTHTFLFPQGTEERVGAVLKMVLCPPVALRANDLLTLQLLAGFHPLAMAAVLCGKEEFERFARQTLLDLEYPTQAEEMDGEGRGAEAWYRQALQRIAREFLRQRDVDLEVLLRPGACPDAATRAYCPRCEAEYAVPAGECADCPGVPLRPYA